MPCHTNTVPKLLSAHSDGVVDSSQLSMCLNGPYVNIQYLVKCGSGRIADSTIRPLSGSRQIVKIPIRYIPNATFLSCRYSSAVNVDCAADDISKHYLLCDVVTTYVNHFVGLLMFYAIRMLFVSHRDAEVKPLDDTSTSSATSPSSSQTKKVCTLWCC